MKWSGDYVRFDARPGDELTITYPLVEFTHEVDGLWKNTAPQLLRQLSSGSETWS